MRPDLACRVSPTSCPGAGGLLLRLMDDKVVRHSVHLDVQDLSGISKLHNHARLIGLLVKGDQLHTALKHIQDPAG